MALDRRPAPSPAALPPTPPIDAETRLHGVAAGHPEELRLWLRLLTCTTLIEGEVRARLRAGFEVTLPRFDLMAQLAKPSEDSEGGITLGELSRRMMVSNGNITGLVERLREQGLLERVPHPADRRAAYVRLTPAGHASFAAMAAAHGDWIAALFEGLDAAEAQTLMTLLGRLKQSTQAAIDTRQSRKKAGT
jgi:DNA-binding MarR family transcriptional regulator